METIKELRKICQSHKGKHRSLSDFGYLWHRKPSIYITKTALALTKGRLRPNQISVFNILFGVIVLSLISLNQNYLPFLILLLLFYFGLLLDKVDGDVARYKKEVTLRGVYLDELYHFFIQNGLILAVGTNRFLATGNKVFLFLGVAGFIIFFLNRYIHKIRYFLYSAKYKSNRDKFSIKENRDKTESLFVSFLNNPLLRVLSFSRRHDIFLFLIFVIALFFFNVTTIWLCFLIIWLAMSAGYFFRFLLLHYFFIDRDILLIDENKL